MKKWGRTLSVLFCVAVCMVCLPLWVGAVAASSMNTVYVNRNHTSTGTGTITDPFQSFQAALDAVMPGGTIIITAGGGFVNVETDTELEPLVINKNVTIKSDGASSDFDLRTAGIALGADVTFENIRLCLASGINNAIFANGYTLTLNNVTRDSGGRQIHLFTGGVLTKNGLAGGVSGSHGHIIINGPGAEFGNIYAGNMNGASDIPQNTITINGIANMSIGDIYACGAKTSHYDLNYAFSGIEPDPPAADPATYYVTGQVDIRLNGSTANNGSVPVSKISGLSDGRIGGTKQASVYVSTQSLKHDLAMDNVAALTLESGRLMPAALNEGVDVTIKNGGILDLSTVIEANGNAFAIGDFTGGGTLQLGQKNVLSITGATSGTTAFEISGVVTGSGIAEVNFGYIDTTQSSSNHGVFTFAPNDAQTGMTLENQNDVWTTTRPTDKEAVPLISFSIPQTTWDVPLIGINRGYTGDIIAAFDNSKDTVDDPISEMTDISTIPLRFSVVHNGKTHQSVEEAIVSEYDGLPYYTSKIEALNLQFSSYGMNIQDGMFLEITRLNPYQTDVYDNGRDVAPGTYAITVTAPTATGDVVQAFTLNIQDFPNKPNAPTGLQANVGDGQVTFSWLAAQNVNQYHYAITEVGSNEPDRWTTLPASTTSHTIDGLTRAKEYTVKVRVFNNDGYYGPAATAKVSWATVPGVPLNLLAKTGDRKVELTWVAPANNGGAAITKYQVYSSSGNWVDVGNTTSHVFNNLTNDIEYTFKVRAVNSVGSGAEVEVKATPKASSTPPVTPGTGNIAVPTTSGSGLTVSIVSNDGSTPAWSSGNTLNVEMKSTSGQSVQVIAAEYKDGALVNQTVKPLTLAENVAQTVSHSATSGNTVKIFVVKADGSMTLLGVSEGHKLS